MIGRDMHTIMDIIQESNNPYLKHAGAGRTDRGIIKL